MALVASVAQAAGVKVEGAWVAATLRGQTASAAYLNLTASEASALVGASTPVAGVVEIHSMSMDQGVMRMRAVPRVELPAAQTVKLGVGGYHVMLLDLKGPLKAGTRVPITLKFEGADKRQSSFEVQAEVRGAHDAAPSSNVPEHQHPHH